MNTNLNIGEILSKGFKITWKFKVLWLFGMLASLGGGSGGSSNMGNNNGYAGNRSSDFFNPLQEMFKQHLALTILGACFLFLLIIAIYFLSVIGKTGLIKGAQQADLGVEKLKFGELWHESLRYFGRMFGLSILIGLPLLAAIALLLVSFFAGLGGMNGQSMADQSSRFLELFGMFVPALCCFGLFAIVIGVVGEQAKLAIVLEDIGVVAGLQRGWNVIKNNFLMVILLSIIMAVIDGVIGSIISFPLLIAVFPALVSYAMMSTQSVDTATTFAPLVIAGICFVAYLPILFVLSGIEKTYNQSVFTLLYLRLTAPESARPS